MNILESPMLIAFLAIFITILIVFIWKKSGPSRTDILLTGLCDSGKTLLFSQLLFGTIKDTHTSISENIGEYKSEKGELLRIVDIPGHERLRSKFFEKYKSIAKGIVFIVDSVTLQKDVRDVADYLYTILADSSTGSVPILLLCNKQDETMAKGCSVIKNLLEKELNVVRTTRTKQLKSVDGSGGGGSGGSDTNVFLGKQGKDFEFNQLPQNIQIIEGSTYKKDYEKLSIWLNKMI